MHVPNEILPDSTVLIHVPSKRANKEQEADRAEANGTTIKNGHMGEGEFARTAELLE
jgi:hypothetical protein